MVQFGREGYGGASIGSISRQAGVATGSVYQFFRSKRQLLLVLMDTLLRRLEELRPPSFGKVGKLPDQIEEFLAEVFAREHEFVGVYRAWQESVLVDAAIAAHDRRIRAWSCARVRNLFGSLAGLPGARSGLDLATLARLWDRFFWNLLAQPPSDRGAVVRCIARTLYHTFFTDRGMAGVRNGGR